MQVRHVVNSACWSVDDDQAAQNFPHWLLVCKAILYASEVRLDIDNVFANAFPGDHYRLLSGLLTVLDNDQELKSIVDVGTHYGTGTRVMLDFAPKAEVATFDISAWTDYICTFLKEEDFSHKGGRLTQHLDDLKEDDAFEKHKALLTSADFIMCDGPKDGVFEREFLNKLSSISFPRKRRFLLLDDIRFDTEMLLWRQIQSPKVDLTSVGHFSGTGLVDISEGLTLLNS
jgi:hypothetical protein